MDRVVFGENPELFDAAQNQELFDAVQDVTTLATLGILGTLIPLYLDARLHWAFQEALRRRYGDLTQLGTADGPQ